MMGACVGSFKVGSVRNRFDSDSSFGSPPDDEVRFRVAAATVADPRFLN